MKFKKIQWLTQTLMTVALAAGINACTDDHFDISSDVNGKQTLWQNIQGNDNLSQFADILQSVYNSKDEKKTSNETYAELLNGDQTFTVWAPVNGSFDYTYYKNLLSLGIRDSIYKVEKELIRNNMTRYSHTINSSVDEKIDLFNDKTAQLDGSAMTMQGVAITTPNIGASNGTLHIVQAPVAYRPNLYEYMASRPDLDSINQYIKSFQTTTFNESASTQGPTVDGYITWVDSITQVTNSFCQSTLRAYINREDSNYAMILPTNTAWNDIKAKTEQYFVYKQNYSQKIYFIKEENGTLGNNVVTEDLSNEQLDSIVNTNVKNAITQNLAFNANWQDEQYPIDNIESIAKADSLKSTRSLKFKKAGTLTQTDLSYTDQNVTVQTVAVEDFANMFGGADPVECSNGYAYVTDSWNLPTAVYASELHYSPRLCLETLDNNCNNPTDPQYTKLTYAEKWIDPETSAIKDTTLTYTVLDIKYKNNTTNPGAYFQLTDVLSCKYDMYVVLNYNTLENRPNKFKVTIDYDNDVDGKRKEKVSLPNPNEDAVDVEGNSLYNTTFYVNKEPNTEVFPVEYTDTICIAKDFSFPVCYYNMENAHPTLYLVSTLVSAERKNKTYSNQIFLNSIILKPKGHDDIISKEEDE